jgi:hypothetical protein
LLRVRCPRSASPHSVTIWQPYQSDPLMFWWAPIVMRWALEDRMAAAGLLAIGRRLRQGIHCRAARHRGHRRCLDGQWRRAFRAAIAGAVAFCVWLGLQAFLRTQFGYTFGTQPVAAILRGQLSALLARADESSRRAVGDVQRVRTHLGSVSFRLAGRSASLRRVCIAALPIAALYAYLQQPDRALWNFHFLTSPLAALVLDAMSTPFIAAFLALYALAYLKVGAEVSFVPQARYAYAVGLVLAFMAAVKFIRERPATPGGGAIVGRRVAWVAVCRPRAASGPDRDQRPSGALRIRRPRPTRRVRRGLRLQPAWYALSQLLRRPGIRGDQHGHRLALSPISPGDGSGPIRLRVRASSRLPF